LGNYPFIFPQNDNPLGYFIDQVQVMSSYQDSLPLVMKIFQEINEFGRAAGV
jgi:hypothetical protein